MKLLFSAILAAILVVPHCEAEMKEFTVSISNHTFSPAELEVPSGEKFKFRVANKDSTPEEFESYDLNREKIVSGGQEITMTLGPLEAGRYEYFGEFNPSTAKGALIAK